MLDTFHKFHILPDNSKCGNYQNTSSMDNTYNQLIEQKDHPLGYGFQRSTFRIFYCSNIENHLDTLCLVFCFFCYFKFHQKTSGIKSVATAAHLPLAFTRRVFKRTKLKLCNFSKEIENSKRERIGVQGNSSGGISIKKQ